MAKTSKNPLLDQADVLDEGSGFTGVDLDAPSNAVGEVREGFGRDADPKRPCHAENGRIEDEDDGMKVITVRKLTAEDGKEGFFLPHRPYVFVIGFDGSAYFGYQKQSEDFKTIEAELEAAVQTAGGVFSLGNSTEVKSVGWSRCARTDKGVHAVCQVAAVKLSIPAAATSITVNDEKEDFPEEEVQKTLTPQGVLDSEVSFCQKINRFLPSDIRCFKLFRVSKRFDARILCESRTYEYVMPADVLTLKLTDLPRNTRLPAGGQIQRNFDTKFDVCKAFFPEISSTAKRRRTVADIELPEEVDSNVDLSSNEEEVDLLRLNKILACFEGPHSFHNFTSSASSSEKRVYRRIHRIRGKIENILGHEVVIIEITGSSFLLHQIRKMAALAIEVYRNKLNEDIIKSAFLREKKFLHIAPGEGLIFLQPCFKAYNEQRANPPFSPKIEFAAISEECSQFKRRIIYPKIVESIESKLWKRWLYMTSPYGNTAGAASSDELSETPLE